MRRRAVIFISILILLAIVFYIFNLYKKTEVSTSENNISETNKILPPQEGLPPLVEAKRQAIYAAALSRSYDNLNKETSEDFHYSFGGEYEEGFVGYLKLAESNEGKSVFDVIPILLRLPYAMRDNLYTWPSVFTIEPSKWTMEDIRMMKTFLTEEQIEGYRQYGGYIFYRLGITAEGDWTFYLAGD